MKKPSSFSEKLEGLLNAGAGACGEDLNHARKTQVVTTNPADF